NPVQIDYVRSLIFRHQIETTPKVAVKVFGDPAEAGKGGNIGAVGGQLHFVREAQPHRMLVVSAVFPMKKEVEEFCLKLRMAKQKELYESRDDWPRPLAINIYRYEVINGKEGTAELLVRYTGTEE